MLVLHDRQEFYRRANGSKSCRLVLALRCSDRLSQTPTPEISALSRQHEVAQRKNCRIGSGLSASQIFGATEQSSCSLRSCFSVAGPLADEYAEGHIPGAVFCNIFEYAMRLQCDQPSLSITHRYQSLVEVGMATQWGWRLGAGWALLDSRKTPPGLSTLSSGPKVGECLPTSSSQPARRAAGV